MFFSAIAHCHEMTFKVVRKSPSKVLWDATSSCEQRLSTGMASKESPGSASTVASRLSNSSSGVSSILTAEKMLGMVRERDTKHQNPKHVVGSSHIRRQADAILKVLSDGDSSEVRIRQLLGDSPDPSKALRM